MDKQLQLTTTQEIPNFVIFKIDNSKANIDVLFSQQTLWLIQKKIVEFFEMNVLAISKHLKNIFETEELKESAVVSKIKITCKNSLQVQTEKSK